MAAHAAITVTGDLSPAYTGADPWTIFAGNLRVGDATDGTMEVTAGSSVSNVDGWLAYGLNTVGDVNIVGADSLWTNQRDLYIGYQGDGTLLIGDGGTVTSVDGYLAYDAAGTGEVMVTGANSAWQNTTYLYVGYAGDANMVVADGGSVTSYAGSLGEEAGSYGEVTVTGAGSSWANSHYLNVGTYGDANMVVTDGGSVTGYSASVGEEAGSYGDVTVTGTNSSWSNTAELIVGNYGDGDMTIADGGTVTAGDSAMAFMPGSTASVLITDANSTFEVWDDLAVGVWGQAQVQVANGGSLISDMAYIGGLYVDNISAQVDEVGYDPNGAGQVTVTGDDSSWDNTDTAYIGYSGDANLLITDGGQVTSDYSLVGFASEAEGDVTVTGPNSVWGNTSGLGVGIFGDGDLVVENGGQVTSLESGIGVGLGGIGTVEVTDANTLWTNTEELAVGISGTGTLTVTNGGRVTNTDAFIGGLDPDAPNLDASFIIGETFEGTGLVEVTGTGSRWDSDGFLYVGYTGTGTLDVNDGGLVTSEYGALGADPNGTGTVTVSDAGSQWSVTEGLAVGAYGQGDLTVTASGLVDANTVYVGGFDTDALGGDPNDVPTGAGTITVTGTGSELEVDDFLYVGYTGTGILDVNDGGLVTSRYGGIGADPNSTGTVTVTDGGSQWSVTEELAVGAYGQGYLTVLSGGLVDVNVAYVGGFDTDALGGDANDVPDGTGTLSVTGTGSELEIDDFLYVGYTGTGALNVNDGGLVSSLYGGIGADPNSTGTVTITDAGSRWSISEGLAVGAYGDGDLMISSGGLVDANAVYIGGFDTAALGGDANDVPTGTGTLTVTGSGSELDVADNLYAGYTGDGTLVISGGGQVDSQAGYIAYLADSTGSAIVGGSNSTWTPTDLYVGYVGDGSLQVSSGGVVDTNEFIVGAYDTGSLLVASDGAVDANTVWIGQAQHSVGAATVTGSGAMLDMNDAYIGAWGNGSMTVADGAEVRSEMAVVGFLWSSTGAVTVSGTDALWGVANGLTVGYNGVASMAIRAGGQVTSSTGMIASSSPDGTGNVTVSGTGSLWDIDSGLYVGGDATAAGGTAVLDINDGGSVTANDVVIWDNGTLSGDSTLTAPTVTNHGTIAPGNSIGTLTIDGDLTMDANSVLAVEVDNDGNSDLLHVTGDVEIEGGTVQVSSEETIRGSYEYTILDANSVTGEFDVLDTALLRAGAVTADLDYDTTVVTLEVTALGFDLGETRNQRSLGVGLQEIAVGGGNAITTLLQNVPTDAELLDHYDQLAGQSRPSLAPIGVAGTSQFMGTVSDRLRRPASMSMASAFDTDVAGQAGPDAGVTDGMSYEINTGGTNFAVGNGTPYLSESKWGFWGKGYGLFGTRDDDVEAPGYDYTIYGLSFGLDCQVTETMLLGVTAGYSDGDVDYDRLDDSTDLSSTHVGLYGSWDFGNAYLDSLVSYTDLEYETERAVDLTDEQLEGEFDGIALSGYFESGFDWRRINGWMLQPLASFQFAYLDLDEYTETGGDAALGYDDQTFESYKGGLGVKVTKDLLKDEIEKGLVVQFRARWLHEFGDTHSVVDTYFASDPTTVFAIRDEAMSRDSAVLGMGVGARLNSQTTLYADYDARLNADDTAHLISAGLRYQW